MACDFRKGRLAYSSGTWGSHGGVAILRPHLSSGSSKPTSIVITGAVKVHEAAWRSKTDNVSARPEEHGIARGAASEPYRPGTCDRAVSRFLVATIMKARSWQELEALAHAYTVSFNHVHVSALVCRLPKVVDPARLPKPESSQFSRFLRNVSDLVTIRLSTFDPRAIANVLWAVSKLGYSPAPPTLNKFLFEAYVRMYDFNAQELANLAWALATLAELGNRPVPVWLRKYTLAAVPRVPDLKPQELAHLAWAVSKLFPQGAARSTARTLLNASIDPDTASASPEAGSATHAGADDAQRFGRIHQLSASEAEFMLPGGCSGGASPQGAPDRDVALAAVRSLSASNPSQLSDSSAALPALVAALTTQALALLAKFRCGELIMTLAALHSLDPVAGLRLLRVALPQLLSTSSADLSPQDLAILWQVMGKCAADGAIGLELLPAPEHSGVSEASGGQCRTAFAADAQRPAAGVSGDGGRVTTESLKRTHGGARGTSGSCRTRLGRHHLHALMDVTARALPGFTAQGLCLVLWSWARLSLRPNDAMAHAVFQRFQQVLPSQATFQSISISLWAAAQLRLRPDPAAMDMFASCARLQMPASKPGELTALLWALQHLRFRPSRELLAALNTRLREVIEQLPAEGLQGVLRAYAVFGSHVPRQVQDRALALAASVTATPASGAAAGVRETLAPAPTSVVAEPMQEATGASAVAGLAPPPGAPGGQAVVVTGSSAMASLLRRPPCAIVRYFATLAGVGIAAQSTGTPQRVASTKLQMLRWKLEASAELRRALRAAIESSVQDRLHELDSEALCALLASLVRLHLKPRAAFLKQVHELVSERAASLTHWQAGGILASLARLRSRPQAEVVTRLLAAIEPQLDAMTDSQLLSVVEALARLRFRPPWLWLRRYFSECMARANTWPATSLDVFLRSLAALRLQLTEAPCRKLRVVVLSRRKGRKAGRAAVRAPKTKCQGASSTVQEPDLARSLCTVCSELEGCSV